MDWKAAVAALVAAALCAQCALARGGVVAGGTFGGGVAVETSGQFAPLGTGLSGNAGVNALATYSSALVAGGGPSFVADGNGSFAHGIAVLENDDVWRPLGGGVDDGGNPYTAFVWALEAGFRVPGDLTTDRVLFAAGQFTAAGGTSATNIALWDGAEWSALGAGIFGSANALTTYRDSLIAAGELTRAGGNPVNHVAAWNGTAWAPLQAGTDNDIFAAIVHEDRLVVGGYFTTAGDAAGTSCIATWDGVAWASLGGGFAYGSIVTAMTLDDSVLLVAGWLYFPGDTTATYVAAWTTAGWSAVASEEHFVYYTLPSAIIMSGTRGASNNATAAVPELYVGGMLTMAADVSVTNVAVFDYDSLAWVNRGTPDGAAGSEAFVHTFARFAADA